MWMTQPAEELLGSLLSSAQMLFQVLRLAVHIRCAKHRVRAREREAAGICGPVRQPTADQRDCRIWSDMQGNADWTKVLGASEQKGHRPGKRGSAAITSKGSKITSK